jgi:hypothetical protein
MPFIFSLKRWDAHPNEAVDQTAALAPEEALIQMANAVKVDERLELCAPGEGEFRLERYSGQLFSIVEKQWDVRRVMRAK